MGVFPPAVNSADNMELTGLDDDMGLPEPAIPVPEVAAEPVEPISVMPEEPAETVEHIKVSFRFPDGKRVTKRFVPTDAVEQMFAVASATVERPARLLDLSTQFPKRSIRDVEGGLQATMKDAQVANNMVM